MSLLEIEIFEQDGLRAAGSAPAFLGAFAAPGARVQAGEIIAGRVALHLKDETPDAIAGATARALEAFRANRFILLYDGRQVVDPDEKLEATGANRAVFLRLAPLVGG